MMRNRHVLVVIIALAILGWRCTPSVPSQEDSTGNDAVREILLDTIVEYTPEKERVEYTINSADNQKQGLYTRWSPSGKKLEEAYFENGLPDGIRLLYYEKGDTHIVETYQKGAFQGDYRLYHPNGKLKQQGLYRDNQMAGIWTSYYENGALKEKVTYSNNLENGAFQEYYSNGVLQVEGTYKNGDKEHGVLKFYDPSGKHIKTMDCQNGVCRTVWKYGN